MRVFWVFSLFSVVASQSDTSCKTPDGLSGQCIQIKECNYLTNKFENVPKPLPVSRVEELLRYHCGFQETAPKVCCPLNTSLSAQSSDVSNHRNLHLINGDKCGGKAAALSHFPWMALISYRGRGGELSFRCTGSLINENYILTAAHCVTALTYTLEGVRLGEYDISKEIDCYNGACAPPVQDHTVSQIIPHPLYERSKLQYDIALIRLTQPANFQLSTVKPICLPVQVQNEHLLSGKGASVVGWGVTESGRSSSKLLNVTLPIISNEECQSRYKEVASHRVNITQSQLCAGGVPGKDACAGDGGGPLSVSNSQGFLEQYGIVSFGSRLCGTDNLQLPGVYTRVSHYIGWILDNILP